MNTRQINVTIVFESVTHSITINPLNEYEGIGMMGLRTEAILHDVLRLDRKAEKAAYDAVMAKFEPIMDIISNISKTWNGVDPLVPPVTGYDGVEDRDDDDDDDDDELGKDNSNIDLADGSILDEPYGEGDDDIVKMKFDPIQPGTWDNDVPFEDAIEDGDIEVLEVTVLPRIECTHESGFRRILRPAFGTQEQHNDAVKRPVCPACGKTEIEAMVSTVMNNLQEAKDIE